MQQLANITVTPKPGHLFDSWASAGQWLSNMQLSGFEIYPHGCVNAKDIPTGLVGGFHLQSFPILTPLLYNDSKRLMQIFGDWKTVEQFYGGTDANHIVNVMVSQLNLAAELNTPYVVFHPMDCDMEHLFCQQFPWTLNDTLNACSELLNLALSQSHFKGWLLFENMWWKQSFRLESRCEYDKLRTLVNHNKCGICFDTGHMMSTNSKLTNETDAVAFLQRRLQQLDLNQEIKTLHLNSNLSSKPSNHEQHSTCLSHHSPSHYENCNGFWEQFDVALEHITHLDPHNGFNHVELANLIETIQPSYLVHEVSQNSLFEWSRAISVQMDCTANQAPAPQTEQMLGERLTA
ncbi:sugar phosphate isomerase/epimerase [Shewanella schlegeliana]|uniref:TIM barrel protein n=1 Tax=Shewanella schlegeliana TaxID=190308 RepID=A0ABS1SZR6_9GAMM|nr:TIM barrel protein [Shewanella schlegeliana]MBL4914026.1 TIM barrel protein [Shewanella schlegeliana]MCL1108591.1 sugar phosphate isomerase/epimerase [Shewanella schlegeliana]GIU35716.1 xylose isomerase [Shewanella schlegeliana]